MFTFIKKSFNDGAAGIDVSCKNCGHMNFVSTKATSAKVICKNCGKEFELSESNKDTLRLMIAQSHKLG